MDTFLIVWRNYNVTETGGGGAPITDAPPERGGFDDEALPF